MNFPQNSNPDVARHPLLNEVFPQISANYPSFGQSACIRCQPHSWSHFTVMISAKRHPLLDIGLSQQQSVLFCPYPTYSCGLYQVDGPPCGAYQWSVFRHSKTCQAHCYLSLAIYGQYGWPSTVCVFSHACFDQVKNLCIAFFIVFLPIWVFLWGPLSVTMSLYHKPSY